MSKDELDPILEDDEPLTPESTEAESAPACEEELKAHGFTVEPKYLRRRMRDEKGNPYFADVASGFLLVRDMGDFKHFIGTSLRMGERHVGRVSDSFETKEQAIETAKQIIADEKARGESKLLPVKFVGLDVWICECTGNAAKHVQVQLDIEQARTLKGIQMALQQANKRLANGSPIASTADVVRWMLEGVQARLSSY